MEHLLPPISSPLPPPRLVFIVEDSDACAETLEIALDSLQGFEPRRVNGAPLALAQMRQHPSRVAAVVTDMHLAQSSGLDLIRDLRADIYLCHVPVILISGDTDPLLPERAFQLGANAFFAKPYSPAAVRRKLEQLL
jgi:two-component system, chemotaxis family, chemotaxis protein CheY